MVGMSAGIPMYGIGSRSVRPDHALDDLHLTIVSAVAINNNGTIAANVSNGTSGHGVGLLFNASACTIK
jgi:hypothetical protein